MPTGCIFSSLVKSDFNSYMATLFSVTSLVRFDRNPSMATSYIGLLSSTLSFKTFELKFNLSKKYWNDLKLVSSSRNDMLKKMR
jgi:hypothetical protein